MPNKVLGHVATKYDSVSEGVKAKKYVWKYGSRRGEKLSPARVP